MKSKKLVIFSSLLPCTEGNNEAANVILHQIIENLMLTNNFQIFYCLVADKKPEKNKYTDKVVKELKEKGLKFLPPLFVPKYKRNFFEIAYYFLSNSPDKIFAGSELQKKIDSHLGFRPDLVLPIWSELSTHACSRLKCKKFN